MLKLFSRRGTEENLIYEDEYIRVRVCPINTLYRKEYINWNKNRPIDEIRVQQIVQYYKETDCGIIPGIISLWKNKDKYEVYDGAHRLFAGFSSELNLQVIIQERLTRREKDIIDDFLNLNKSICVPSIYLEETSTVKKLICEQVASWLCRKYSAFVSPSRKPFIYNFNRDNFVELISEVEIDFMISDVEKKIIKALTELNLKAREWVITKKIDTPRKCSYNNFYLFYLDRAVIKKGIEERIEGK